MCLHPLRGYRSFDRGESGKYAIRFDCKLHPITFADRYLDVSCGQCIECRISRARHWAVRCVHEAQMHDVSCFLTLTYAPEHIPPGGTLQPRDITLFFKRLRKFSDRPYRYFQAGEYGASLSRPHHHVILFGRPFPDKKIINSGSRYRYYVSDELSRLWPYGYHIIADCNYSTIFYTARYCLKKITGPDAVDHYAGRQPEYITMSRRPGIGRKWYDLYKSDLYPNDYAIVGDRKLSVPRYYDNILEVDDPDLLVSLKERRKERAERYAADRTFDRSVVKSACMEARFARHKNIG